MSTNDPSCAGNGAASFTTSGLDGLAAGDTITVNWATRAGCEQQTVAVAGYRTAHLQFDPTEDQPLIAASARVPLGTHGSLTWTVPDGIHPACRIQIDVVTGPVLTQIDNGHRYNKPGFGLDGGNDLIAATYADDPTCAPVPTAPPGTVTVTVDDPLPPAESTSTTAAPATPPTATTVVEEVGPPVSNPSGPGGPATPYTECVTSTGAPCPESLPVTGGDVTALVWIGGATLLLAALSLWGSRRLRRNEP